jgi:oxalate decarboxylase
MSAPQDPRVSRRLVVAGLGSAALLSATGRIARGQSGASPASDTHSQNTATKPPTDPGPENPPLLQENADSWTPPKSDAGDVNAFKYSFSLGHNRISDGGWARQVTVRDLPIAKDIAGVNMRLNSGAIRELHWHIPAEWAYMLYGTARVTAVDQKGRAFVNDIGPGDLWYFPGGVPHSIQGLAPDGCEFLLAFDDGRFSEFDTFLITDWFDHTPREVLQQDLDLPASTFKTVPPKELYIFNAPLPKSLEEDRKAAIGPEGEVPNPFTFKLKSMKPDEAVKGGEVRIADSHNFKASITVAAALVTLRPGGLRVLHWHPNADEWQYYTTGKGRMTVFTGGGKARTMDFQAGDVGYVQQSLPHYIQNTGDTDLEFLELFKSDHYEDITLSNWISHLPPELVQAHLGFPEAVITSIPKAKSEIVPR